MSIKLSYEKYKRIHRNFIDTYLERLIICVQVVIHENKITIYMCRK